MPYDGNNNDPPKPKYDPFEYPEEKSKKSCKDNKVDSKTESANDLCEKLQNECPEEVNKKSVEPTEPKVPCPTSQKQKLAGPSLKDKIKLPRLLAKMFATAPDLKSIKNKLPDIDINRLKQIEYGKLLKCGFYKLNNWIRENCNPKKMADKGSGAPSRPMKFPYTFSAKIAQFPMGYYVKNQWIWKYYVFAFAACLPVFYSINKLANSPGNVAKWAEIRRKEAAEHHH